MLEKRRKSKPVDEPEMISASNINSSPIKQRPKKKS